MSTHEIISATENPCGGVSLTIRWSAGTTTTQYYGSEAAKALGWKRPDPQPVDPAWMEEVAREVWEAGIDSEIIAILALSRGHVVLAPVMPSEEEMLKGAREDAAQINDTHYPDWAEQQRAGAMDTNDEVRAALQARRNVYASLGAVSGRAVSSGPVVPEVDLRGVAKKAWANGFTAAIDALQNFGESGGYEVEREKDVSAILETLKSGEA